MYTIHIDEKTVCISNEAAYKAFCREFKEVDAAGGLVRASRASVAGEGAGTAYLFIRRNGLWDLPKGHREEGEDIETTALREVSEETGLPYRNMGNGEVPYRNAGNDAQAGTKPAGQTLAIDRSQGHNGLICITDHCYLRGGIWHLKHTWWYAMKLVPDSENARDYKGEGICDDAADIKEYTGEGCVLTPQTEEGISDALWLTSNEISPKMQNAYSSIRDVVRAAFSQQAPERASLSEHSDAGSH